MVTSGACSGIGVPLLHARPCAPVGPLPTTVREPSAGHVLPGHAALPGEVGEPGDHVEAGPRPELGVEQAEPDLVAQCWPSSTASAGRSPARPRCRGACRRAGRSRPPRAPRHRRTPARRARPPTRRWPCPTAAHPSGRTAGWGRWSSARRSAAGRCRSRRRRPGGTWRRRTPCCGSTARSPAPRGAGRRSRPGGSPAPGGRSGARSTGRRARWPRRRGLRRARPSAMTTPHTVLLSPASVMVASGSTDLIASAPERTRAS